MTKLDESDFGETAMRPTDENTGSDERNRMSAPMEEGNDSADIRPWWPVRRGSVVLRSPSGAKTLKASCLDLALIGAGVSFASFPFGFLACLSLLRAGWEALPPMSLDSLMERSFVLSCAVISLLSIAAVLVLLVLYILICALSSVAFLVVWSLPIWVRWSVTVSREAAKDVHFRVRGNADGDRLEFSWLADSSGIVVTQFRETSWCHNLLSIPDGPKVPAWNGQTFHIGRMPNEMEGLPSGLGVAGRVI